MGRFRALRAWASGLSSVGFSGCKLRGPNWNVGGFTLVSLRHLPVCPWRYNVSGAKSLFLIRLLIVWSRVELRLGQIENTLYFKL